MNSDFRPVNKGVKMNKLRCEGLECDVAAMLMTNVEDNVAVSLIFLQRIRFCISKQSRLWICLASGFSISASCSYKLSLVTYPACLKKLQHLHNDRAQNYNDSNGIITNDSELNGDLTTTALFCNSLQTFYNRKLRL